MIAVTRLAPELQDFFTRVAERVARETKFGAGYLSREIHICGYPSHDNERDFSMFSARVVADFMASRLRYPAPLMLQLSYPTQPGGIA